MVRSYYQHIIHMECKKKSYNFIIVYYEMNAAIKLSRKIKPVFAWTSNKKILLFPLVTLQCAMRDVKRNGSQIT